MLTLWCILLCLEILKMSTGKNLHLKQQMCSTFIYLIMIFTSINFFLN